MTAVTEAEPRSAPADLSASNAALEAKGSSVGFRAVI